MLKILLICMYIAHYIRRRDHMVWGMGLNCLNTDREFETLPKHGYLSASFCVGRGLAMVAHSFELYQMSK